MGNTTHYMTPCDSSSNTEKQERSKTTLTISIATSPPRHEMHSKSVSLHSPATNALLLSPYASYPTPNHSTHLSTTFKPSTTTLNQKRRSSLLNVRNGITGKHICSRICKVAASFWYNKIDSLPVSDRLELACSIFFSMLASHNNMKDLVRRASKSRTSTNIEDLSLTYLNMMGWIIRHLATSNPNLHASLTRLGCIHRSMGINGTHFGALIQAIHDTFAYYFVDVYNTELQHAMDVIFRLATKIMTGCDLKRFEGTDHPFLQSLDACLESSVGREYLFQYLAQTWCDEIVIFFKSLHRFKTAVNETERLAMARYICQSSINATATFSLNLSYEHRVHATHDMEQLELLFVRQQDGFKVPIDLFVEVERETMQLITMNHWTQFVKRINTQMLNPKRL
eukprot:279688_1